MLSQQQVYKNRLRQQALTTLRRLLNSAGPDAVCYLRLRCLMGEVDSLEPGKCVYSLLAIGAGAELEHGKALIQSLRTFWASKGECKGFLGLDCLEVYTQDVRPGCTPDNNPVLRDVLSECEEYLRSCDRLEPPNSAEYLREVASSGLTLSA